MTTAEPRAAAALMLATADGQILVGERAATVRFMPGYVSVPGGKVDAQDQLDAANLWPDDPDGARKAAAVRELREECGVIMTDLGLRPEPTELRGVPTHEALQRLGVGLSASTMELAGRWVTPDYSPIRFDTSFYLAVVPEVVEVTASPELAWAGFRAATEMWRSYLDLNLLLPPPFRASLEILVDGIDGAPERLRKVPGANGDFHVDFEPISGIRQLPLLTPTLPPAAHTNAYVIGHERLVVVDPAPYASEPRNILQSFLQDLIHKGATFDSVILTHHHPDHMGAAQWLADAFDVPIRAHRITRDLLEGQVKIDALIEQGDRIDLGPDRAGRRFELEVLFTPGHAPGHIVLADRRPGATSMIVGDMVASIGTIIIDPPEGNMAVYLDQLRRLRARPQGVLFPAHGDPIVDGHGKLDHYVQHRLQRENKVLEALRHVQHGEPVDLLPIAYADTPPQLYPLAARSCLAHLEKLVIDGQAQRDGASFVSVEPKNGASC